MATRVLTLRELNRATLARQMLLGRVKKTPLRAIEQLVGLQAQEARPPFIGLWSRLAGFGAEQLIRLLDRRTVVRATMMRGTLHLFGATDYARLRPAVQPALSRGMASVLRGRADRLDINALVAVGREFFGGGAATFADLRAHLAKRFPRGDERAMAFAVRTHLPLVQVPAENAWGFSGRAAFTTAERWLDVTIETEPADPRKLIRRYLAAFGPASVGDIQTWSGLAGQRESFESLRTKLRTFHDETGRELFDLPDAPRPAADTETPPRYLPGFDNLVLAHDDRSRVVAAEHRSVICTANLRVLPTFLLDGFVAGTWKIERTKRRATLIVEPFKRLSKVARDGLAAEAEPLLRFAEPEAGDVDVRIH